MFGILMLATIEATEKGMNWPEAFAIVGGALALAWIMAALFRS
jgi:hypothetical protein